ncbi:hypothetical protein [Halomontanus rarus]|uniref:hypothetical protein n=1 Tax=Halomontanus rarus TaxID=3034020 RepID=UPI0023E83C01|nr:hypothetical protein [Halovivax sp. TS33]
MTMTLILGFVFTLIVLFIILPISVYYDAQQHEIDNPSEWAAIVLLRQVPVFYCTFLSVMTQNTVEKKRTPSLSPVHQTLTELRLIPVPMMRSEQ